MMVSYGFNPPNVDHVCLRICEKNMFFIKVSFSLKTRICLPDLLRWECQNEDFRMLIMLHEPVIIINIVKLQSDLLLKLTHFC